MVKASASRAADLEVRSRFLCGDFSGLSHTCELKASTPVATLPGAWHYRCGAGWPSVSILQLGEIV